MESAMAGKQAMQIVDSSKREKRGKGGWQKSSCYALPASRREEKRRELLASQLWAWKIFLQSQWLSCIGGVGHTHTDTHIHTYINPNTRSHTHTHKSNTHRHTHTHIYTPHRWGAHTHTNRRVNLKVQSVCSFFKRWWWFFFLLLSSFVFFLLCLWLVCFQRIWVLWAPT